MRGRPTELRARGIKWAATTVHLSVLLAGYRLQAQPGSPARDLELIPEDQSLWKESLLWDKDVVLRAGFGYKDNVLLAPSAAQGSAFFASGLDLTIYRLPLDGWEFNFTVIADDVRYFRKPGGLSGEDLLVGNAQLQRYFGAGWRAGMEPRYTYADQVLEEFLAAGGAQAVEAKGHVLGLRPFVRRDLSTNWWVQLETPIAHEWWQAPLDPSWKVGGQGILGFALGSRSQLDLTAGAFYIPHEQWLARDALGIEIPGRKLALWRQVAELKWDQHWDSHDHWTTTARAGVNHNTDNGGGFFDSYRYYVSTGLRYRSKDWEAKGSAGLSYYDFPVQTIDTPPAPLLHLATVQLNLRLERRIYKALRCFGSYEYEQTISDDPASQYKYNVVTGGMSWEF